MESEEFERLSTLPAKDMVHEVMDMLELHRMIVNRNKAWMTKEERATIIKALQDARDTIKTTTIWKAYNRSWV